MSPSDSGKEKGTTAKRASAPKSRNGCVTCKARRVKCDETKPDCNACLKANRQCLWKQKKERTQRILIPQNTDILSQSRPSETLHFIDPREASYFKAYQEETAPELSGLLRTSVWSYTLLQACYQEPFILRGVVAVGALHKAIQAEYTAATTTDLTKESKQLLAQQHRAFALASYDKAILGMKEIVPGPKKCSSLRKALLACLLVYCMENFLQSPNTAFYQSQTGYSLLQDWIARKSQRNHGIQSPDPSVIEDEIFQEFARTDLQHAIRWGEKDLLRHSTRRLEGETTVKNMPARFTHLEEARVYSELLMRRTYHLIGESYARIIALKDGMRHPFTTDTPGELVDPCSLPTILFPERDRYITSIHAWLSAFSTLFSKLLSSPDPLISSSAALLRLNMLNAEIRLTSAFFVTETAFDAFDNYHAEILALSKHVIQKTNLLYPKNAPTFLFPDLTERPLVDLALTCRLKPLRQEALSLLRATAHRDPTAKQARYITYASFIVSLEEEGRLPSGELPEEARWRRIWLLHHYKEEQRHLTIVACKRVGNPLGERYPARREYKRVTFTQEEAESMVFGGCDVVDCVTEGAEGANGGGAGGGGSGSGGGGDGSEWAGNRRQGKGGWKEEMHFAPWSDTQTLRIPRPLQWRAIFEEMWGLCLS